MSRKKLITNHYQLPTISSWLTPSINRLKNASIDSARIDALVILENELQKSREWLLAHFENELSEKQIRTLNAKITQRINGTPLAYIIGSKEFYGRDYFVNKNVLIPRPESECIIEILQDIIVNRDVLTSGNSRSTNNAINTIIDIGTGSGCLAITAKLLYPDTHVMAIDISGKALKVAKKNARMHNVQVQFKQLDITKKLPQIPKTRPYIFLANLPYVPDDLITSKEILKEPGIALFSGNDGMNHYREFWNQIASLKNKPRYIITECLKIQHRDQSQLASNSGYTLKTTKTLARLFEYHLN